MKNLLPLCLALSLVLGCGRQAEPQREEADAAPKQNNAVTLDAAAQQRIGLETQSLQAATLNTETKAYGRVVDPAPLVADAGDLEIAKVANGASQAELQRLKTLAAQNNASERALQAAEVTAAHDQAAFDAARLKLLANWGSGLAERQDLKSFVESLGKFQSALVRIDLAGGESLAQLPSAARIVTLDNSVIAGTFIGQIPSVDPQTQSQSLLFAVETNSTRLAPGSAVTGFLQTGNESLNGVIVPRSAVIRHEGVAWAYVQMNRTNFLRQLISLDQPTEGGWFQTNGISAGDNVVVTGAETVFSAELSANEFNAGERD